MDDALLRNFLDLPYDKLEEFNLAAKHKRDLTSPGQQQQEYRAYLEKEKRIKAVTLCFSDIEGRFHMLDYDKKFLLSSSDNLTFDGSSVRGFTSQGESDLRLSIDWTSFLLLPSDIFGPGKVIMFANVHDREGKLYESDFRGRLQQYTNELRQKKNILAFAAAEIEGFLVEGVSSEQNFDERTGFSLITSGGYYHSLPMDKLRQFIDKSAEAQRAMGFENEKDHPEVAPSQFELNFSYAQALRICDQIQLYKLVCRQIAHNMGMTATFLPKPVMGINGNGMHTNLSLAKIEKDAAKSKVVNLFYDQRGQDGISAPARDFISRILNHAPEISLILNPSVNAYRRLDPHFEAPNQIKVSANDRGAMIRIPMGNEKTARIEIRSVAPDANPYLVLYCILYTGMSGEKLTKQNNKRDRLRYLPSTIYEAIKLYKSSDMVSKMMNETTKQKYVFWKEAAADRSPKELGMAIKTSEIIYHHEITNQALWRGF